MQRLGCLMSAVVSSKQILHLIFASRSCLWKLLLREDSTLLQEGQLKKAATYSLDRKKLFSLITLQKIKKQKEKITQTEIKKEIEKDLEIGAPLEFDEDEMHSFSEWLVLSKIKKIDRQPKAQTEDLIDSFIEKNVTISKPKKETFFRAVDVAKESLIENNDLVTPTLARVYLEKGYYEKAISDYEKLILKYPEKNSFFANQIKLIHDLKEQ